MPFLTEAELRRSNSPYRSPYIESSKYRARVTIFLSHSHKDKDLVLGFINLLGSNSQISIYVDWQDSTMPRITNRETASAIKKRIDENHCFMILATKNAMESRWVPWEIGVADVKKAWERIILVPIADPQGNFVGNEYLQLYQRLEITTLKEVRLVQPDSIGSINFKSWLVNRF
ncbi:MAG: toll/interleukin-1 receptor domain-containing protein [Chloroflexota bacterium]|nr:toll/interleukin-1 receptor domain-containing protein [Chloroflexota bacterium]